MDKNPSDQSKIQQPRRQFTSRERARHLSQWERSGLSASEYAKRNNLESRHLYAWKGQRRRREGKAGGSGFIPVRLTGTLAGSPSLCITLRHHDIEYVVNGTSDVHSLVSVVRVLRQEVLNV